MTRPLPLSDLVRNYGKILPDVLRDAVQPIYNFELESVFSPAELEHLKTLGSDLPLKVFTEQGPVDWTGPLPGQQHVIAALVKAWQVGVNKSIIRGEAGIGKTQITLMALEMAHRAGLDVFPALVIEPRRVTKQWRERIKVIVPDAMTMKIERPPDVELFATMARIYRGRKKLFGLVPTSMLSRSSGFRPVGRPVAYREEQFVTRGKVLVPSSIMLRGKYPFGAIGCPTCFAPLVDIVAPWSRYKKDSIRNLKQLERVIDKGFRVFCPSCGGALFEESTKIPLGRDTRTGTVQFDVGEYIYLNRKRLSRLARGPVFQTLVIDELHKMANDSSIRSETTAELARMSAYQLGLSATIYGGTAGSLFWLYFMFFPEAWPEWGRMDQAKLLWTKELANMAKITRTDKAKEKESKAKRELPAAPPRLVKMLAPKLIHVKLNDLGIAMPPLEVSGLRVKLDPEHQAEYKKMFESAVAKAQGGQGSMFASAHLQSSLTYALAPTMEYHSKHTPNIKIFPETYICAPERAVIEFIRAEVEAKRKTILYVTHTDVRDLVPRLMSIMLQSGITSVRLPKNLDREDMPVWLMDEAPKNDVVILNQKAIEGVDAIRFQSVFFYEVDYSVYPVDQAARRHWRLGQTAACKTVFLEVEGTMLFRALVLVMQRMAASSVLYGDDIETQIGKYSAHSLLTQAIKEELAGVELPDLGSLYKKAAEALTEKMAPDSPESKKEASNGE